MGALVMLVDAFSWAVAGTIVTAKLSRVDFFSVATSRSVFALLFVLPAMFVLGAQGDLWGMNFHVMWQLIIGGLVAYTLAEPGYVLSLSLLGLTRGYTAVIGLYSLCSYIFPAIFLGEPIGLQEALGGALIIGGVYVVAFYGRGKPLAVTAITTSLLRAPPTFFLGSVRPPDIPLEPVDDLDLPLRRFTRWERIVTRFERRPVLRPISGGNSLADVAVDAPAAVVAPAVPPSHIRLPGTAIQVPRLLVGTLIALLTAMAWAGDTTLLRSVAGPFDASAVAVIQLAPGAFVIAVALLLVRRGRVFGGAFTPRAGVLLGLTGMMTTGLGTILVVFAIGEIGPGPVAVLFAMSTIFAMPLSAIFLKERITLLGVVGAAVSVGGVALLAS